MNFKSISRAIATFLLAAIVFCLAPGKAYAVSQEEIDELRRERLAIAMEHDEKQAIVDELEEEKASVVERKAAMDERNTLTRRQIESLQQEVILCDQLIAQDLALVPYVHSA